MTLAFARLTRDKPTIFSRQYNKNEILDPVRISLNKQDFAPICDNLQINVIRWRLGW
jgi:hypothetical protein